MATPHRNSCRVIVLFVATAALGGCAAHAHYGYGPAVVYEERSPAPVYVAPPPVYRYDAGVRRYYVVPAPHHGPIYRAPGHSYRAPPAHRYHHHHSRHDHDDRHEDHHHH